MTPTGMGFDIAAAPATTAHGTGDVGGKRGPPGIRPSAPFALPRHGPLPLPADTRFAAWRLGAPELIAIGARDATAVLIPNSITWPPGENLATLAHRPQRPRRQRPQPSLHLDVGITYTPHPP